MISWLKSLLSLPAPTQSPRFLLAFNRPGDCLPAGAEMCEPGVWCLPDRSSGFEPLFQLQAPELMSCLVTLRAELRAEHAMEGTCLELLARLPGLAPRVARTVPQTLAPARAWEFMEVTIHLGPDQRPTLLRLGLATENPGTIWIRNVKVLVTPVGR